MSTLYKFSKFLSPDERSGWEHKQERLFIDAANGLENYNLNDQGRLSMDPEEARKPCSASLSNIKSPPQIGHRLGVVQAGLLMQRYARGRLDSVSAARYESAVKVITRDDLAGIPTSSRQSKHMTTNLKELCDGR